MKRVYKSPATPERLRSYVKAFPDETWEHFRRRNRRGYREVKQQLLRISTVYARIVRSVSSWLSLRTMLMISGWSISSPK